MSGRPGFPLAVAIAGSLALGCTKAPDPAPASAVADPPHAVADSLREHAEEGLEIRELPIVLAGDGWVSTEYVLQLARLMSIDHIGDPDTQSAGAMKGAGPALGARLPFDFSKTGDIISTSPHAERVTAYATFVSEHEDLFARMCGRPVTVLVEISRLPQDERHEAIWDACALDRFALMRKTDGFGAFISLAAMLYVALEERGGVLDLERIFLRNLAGPDPIVFSPYTSQRAALAARPRSAQPGAPQPWEPSEPPEGVREVIYPSGELELKAWLSVPPSKRKRHPALVYLHGGFAFDGSDFEATQPFRDAGFVVMAPTLRGENGNPGDFELFLGEVDDAAAAIRWLAQQPAVDPEHVYAFGHSAGGAVAALVSLVPDLPLVHSGSAAGLYLETDLAAFVHLAPFDVLDPLETSARVLFGHTEEMHRPHHAWLDDTFEARVQAELANHYRHSRLAIEIVGDTNHASVSAPALEGYLRCIREGACPERPPGR